MTASIQNTLSAIEVLEKALEGFETQHGAPRNRVPEPAFHLRTLLNSVRKCFDSLAAQIRFYQSAKGTGRALIVQDEDGSQKYVCGQLVQTLRLALPGQPNDAVVYGQPEALKAIADALAAAGETVTGPAPIHEHARQLASIVSPPDQETKDVRSSA